MSRKRRSAFEVWWDANDMDSDPDANYTVSEIIWLAAQEALRRKRRKKRVN